MDVLRPTQSLIAAATFSRKCVNQDAAAVLRNERVPLAAIVVADGLGSHFGAEAASELAVASVCEGLRAISSEGEIDLPRLYRDAVERIESYAIRSGLPNGLDARDAFGTTLLAAVETERQVHLSYVGNGGILHVRSDFTAFPETQLLPWSAMNYLNPHARSKAGKNVLYRLLSIRSTEAMVRPTLLTLSKDEEWCGDILVACTDGIYSFDQSPIGKDSDGRIWISAEETMVLLYQRLGAFFAAECYTDEALSQCLEDYLRALDQANLVSDDCTLAVLVTGRALAFQKHLRSAGREEALA